MPHLLQQEGFAGLSPLRLLEGDRQPLFGQPDVLPLDAAQAPTIASPADLPPEEQPSAFRDFSLRVGARPGSLLNFLSGAFGQGTSEIRARKRGELLQRREDERRDVEDRFNLARTQAAERALTAPADRKTAKDASGFLRFLDGDRERVFPDAQTKEQEGFTNITESGPGVFTGLNKATGQIEEIPSTITGETAKQLEFADKKDQVKFDRTSKLNQELARDPRIKDFLDLTPKFDRIQAATDTPAGDISLIFAFMKMLDPTSVVREGEFATAQNSGSVPDNILSSYNRALSGERLIPERRNDFKNQAQLIFDKSRDTADKAVKPFEARAKRSNIDPSVIRNSIFGIPQTPAAPVIPGVPASAIAIPGLPQGAVDNGDGTFDLPNGRTVRRKVQ